MEKNQDREDISLMDCLNCNKIEELPSYAAHHICLDCGQENYITQI